MIRFVRPRSRRSKISGRTVGKLPRSSHWHWLLRLLLPAGMLLFAFLLLNAVDQLDWVDIRTALLRLESRQIWGGIMLTLVTYAAASSYELLSKAHERHPTRTRSCLAIGFVAYSIAINLSSLLGNWAARYRLYARQGIGFRKTTRIAVLSISTNWSGFVLLAGLIFLFAPPELPARWPIHQAWLHAAGALLLCFCCAYLVWCYRASGHCWHLRGIRFTVPTLTIALMQLALSALVWGGIAGVVTHFLPAKAEYFNVLAVLFLSTVAGLVIRVPAGVGVTEVVFVAVLGPQLGTSAIVAALIAYRSVFQLLPLLLGASLYLVLELQWRRAPASTTSGALARLETAR